MAQKPDTTGMTFGVEIEVTSISHTAAGAEVAKGLGIEPGYDATHVRDAAGREWKVVGDCSISPPGCEVVTPPLTTLDMETLQNVIRALRTAGAKVNDSCGIHVHVGSGHLPPAALSRLARTVYRYEWVIEQMLRPLQARRDRYCRPVDPNMVESLARQGNSIQADGLNRAWYRRNRVETYISRYDGSRYSGLNLNSHFYRGTVEFRWFNGTLHAGLIRAYVTLCLHLVAQAAQTGRASAMRFAFDQANPKYATHLLLRRLGIDDKTVRTHLEGHVAGIAAWRSGYPTNRRPGSTVAAGAQTPAPTPAAAWTQTSASPTISTGLYDDVAAHMTDSTDPRYPGVSGYAVAT